MSEDNLVVKVSGAAVYKAVKQYLDNSPGVQQHIADHFNRIVEPAVSSKVQSMLAQLDAQIRYKIANEIELLVKKEVEKRVAEYIAKGIKNMFEGQTK